MAEFQYPGMEHAGVCLQHLYVSLFSLQWDGGALMIHKQQEDSLNVHTGKSLKIQDKKDRTTIKWEENKLRFLPFS